jgi:thiol-disulfide isomerase/thioredoxin
MKKLLFVTAIAFMTVACSAQKDGYTINGNISGLEDGSMVVISNFSRTALVSDTTEIKNGQFTFTGTLATPEMFYLIINDAQETTQSFFLDNSTVTITGNFDDIDNLVIKGSKNTLDAEALKQAERDLEEAVPVKFEDLVTEFYEETTTPARKEEIMQVFNAFEEDKKNLELAYINANSASPYAVFLLSRHIEDFPLDELAQKIETMQQQPALQNNRIINELVKTVGILKSTAVGQTAPDFTQNDPKGNPLTFSDIYRKNKLTMIDFWASWCGPCRQFNPKLTKLYAKYHGKGLEIMAVSLDNDGDKWVKAIESDKLTWHHVSDLQGWNNSVAQAYYVRYIPQNVFVDQNGIILAKQIGEEEIEALLAEHLK